MGRETTSRSKSELLTSDSVVCYQHTSYALVLKFELEREVVSRPTFVLPFGCPKPPPKVAIPSKNPDKTGSNGILVDGGTVSIYVSKTCLF